MKCKCGNTLIIGKSYISFEGDDSPNTETKVFNNLSMLCVNDKCDYYAGDKENPTKPIDANNPRVVVEVLKQPMN